MKDLAKVLQEVIEDIELSWDDGIDTLDYFSQQYLLNYPQYQELLHHLVTVYRLNNYDIRLKEVVQQHIINIIEDLYDTLLKIPGVEESLE